MISCIIPAYNEERFIADVIKAVKSCKLIDEIIVVSDGSTDKTVSIAKNFGVKVIELKNNIGKAGAVYEGLIYSHGDIILLVDADLRGLNNENIEKLIRPVLENKADMAIGINIPFVANKFSGLRAIKRSLLENIISFKGSDFKKLDYNLENVLNHQAKILGLRIKEIKMKGVRNVHKIKKYGIKEGLKRTIRMYYEISVYLIKNAILKIK